MRIYRVQHKDTGIGMYRASNAACEYLGELNTRHPMPYDDAALMDALEGKPFTRLLFAFSSLDQLKFWIHRRDVRHTLKNEGLHIQVYDAPDCWAGDTQCVFDARTATALHTIDLTDL